MVSGEQLVKKILVAHEKMVGGANELSINVNYNKNIAYCKQSGCRTGIFHAVEQQYGSSVF